MKLFKRLNLSWKISLIIVFIVMLIMGSVSYFIYYFTDNQITQEINNRVKLIKKFEKTSINEQILMAKQQIDFFVSDDSLINFVNMLNSRLNKNQSVEGGIYESIVVEWSNNLKNQLDTFNYYDFAYLTSTQGKIMADSRSEDGEISDIIEKELDIFEYKEATIDQLFMVDSKPYILIQRPVYKDNNKDLIGYYTLGLSVEVFGKSIDNQYINGGKIQLINGDGYILAHRDMQLLGKKIEDKWYLDKLTNSNRIISEIVNGSYQVIEKIDDNYNLYLLISIPDEILNKAKRTVALITFIISVIGILLVLISSYIVINKQLAPIKHIVNGFASIEKGYLNDDILLAEVITKRQDEIGVLGQAFNKMVIRLKNIIKSISGTSSEVTQSATLLDGASQEVSKASEHVVSSIQEVAEGSEEQVRNVDSINDKLIRLANKLKYLSDSNQEIGELTTDMQSVTGEGLNKINKVSSQMEHIKKSNSRVSSGIEKLYTISIEIDNIIEIINNIAEQTNLLALNAAIEAARAGEAGRGFSVVADEIRGLAEESAVSADRISKLIEEIKIETEFSRKMMTESNKQVKEGESVVKASIDSFMNINNSIEKVVEKIDEYIKINEEINRDTKEISTNTNGIAEISVTTSASAQEVAASSEEQSASIEELTSIAMGLSELANKLDEMIKGFEF